MPRAINSSINSRLLALKIARRSLRHNLRQSLLIIGIIALPVALATFMLTYLESKEPTAQEKVEIYLGQTQARLKAQIPVNSDADSSPVQGPIYQLPHEDLVFRATQDEGGPIDDPGALQDPRSVELVSGTWITERNDLVEVRTASGVGIFNLIEGALWNEALRGRFQVLEGTPPSSDSEVLVSRAALSRLDMSIGDTIEFSELGFEKTVVGVAEDALFGREIAAIYANTASVTGIWPENDLRNTYFYLLGEQAVSWDTVIELNKLGVGVLSREVLLNPPSDSDVPAIAAGYITRPNSELQTALGGISAFVNLSLVPIAILAGSAFSFGARRQARTLAVMASLGAKPNQLRFITIANGIWLGFLGGLVGTAFGLLVSVLLLPQLSDGSKISYPGFHVPLIALAGIVASASIIGALVSVLPAVRAAKIDVLSTLRGTRSEAIVKRRSGIAGIVIAVIGLILTVIGGTLLASYSKEIALDGGAFQPWILQTLQLLPVLGSLVLVIGLLIMSGWFLVGFRALLGRFGASARYAVNDLLYNRSRYQPVIASVIATSFVAAAFLGIAYSMDKTAEENYAARLPENQLVYDPLWSGTDWSTGETNTSKTREEYLAELAQSNARMESKLRIASAIAPIESAAVVPTHFPLSTLGYKVDLGSGIAEFGAEGEQPLIRPNSDYICPWQPESPRFTEYTQLQDAAALQAIQTDPKFRYCDSVDSRREVIYIGSSEDLSVLLGRPASAEAASILESGGAVALAPHYFQGGKVTLDWYPSGALSIFTARKYGLPEDPAIKALNNPEIQRTVELPAVFEAGVDRDRTIMISEATAEQLEIGAESGVLVVNYVDELTVAQTDQLNADLGGDYNMDSGYPSNPELLAWLVFAIGGVFIISATGIALSLAQVESRADLATLGSVGAPRQFRARVLGLQALLLTGSGAILGSAIGSYLAWSLLALGVDNAYRPALPQLLALAVGIPVFAAAMFFAITPRRTEYRARLALN